MDIHLRIADEVVETKRAVFLNQELSHHLRETDLGDVLATARRQSWKSSRDEGRALGQQLYELLNGGGGQMHELIQRSYDRGDPLWLYFQVPFELDALPLELLYRQQFLLLQSDTHLIRRVTDRNRLRTTQPEKRALTKERTRIIHEHSEIESYSCQEVVTKLVPAATVRIRQSLRRGTATVQSLRLEATATIC